VVGVSQRKEGGYDGSLKREKTAKNLKRRKKKEHNPKLPDFKSSVRRRTVLLVSCTTLERKRNSHT